MSLINFILLSVLSCNVFALTLEEERRYDELEGISFIRALSKDKKFDDAIKQARNINFEEKDLGEISFLLADAHYNLKHFEKAVAVLEKGEQALKKPDQYYALWGRSHLKQKNYRACAEKFDRMRKTDIVPADWTVYFNCLLKGQREKDAVELALNGKFNDNDFFLMAQQTLISYALRAEAQSRRGAFLSACRPVDFYVRLWEVVEKLKAPDTGILERGHACHPAAVEITSHLIKAFFQEGKYHSIAYLFEELSHEDELYFKHTAEFYKVAGRNTVADYFFTLGSEQDYLMARSSHFLNQENYAALLTVPLRPSLMSANKDLSYAVAYSHFKFLALDASRAILGRSTKSNREQQLGNLIEQCRNMDWRCRP